MWILQIITQTDQSLHTEICNRDRSLVILLNNPTITKQQGWFHLQIINNKINNNQLKKKKHNILNLKS